MPTTLWQFKDLFFALRDRDRPAEHLAPWLDAHPEVLAELHDLGRPESRTVRFVSRDREYTPLEGLYALGRVIDVLLAPHQPARPDAPENEWPGLHPSPAAWDLLRARLGAAPVAESAFHPFFHEIVSVQPSDDPDEPPTLIAEHWPGAIVGSLLLARAGVAIRAGANHVHPEVATRSCLYWAWYRRNRESTDLSRGWGSNSQWGTNFRRDYIAQGELHYHVDARRLPGPPPELSEADRLSLLRHRCSLKTDLGNDEWPYSETFTEPAP